MLIPHSDGQLPFYPPELFARTRDTYGAEYPLTFLNDDEALLVEDAAPRRIPSP